MKRHVRRPIAEALPRRAKTTTGWTTSPSSARHAGTPAVPFVGGPRVGGLLSYYYRGFVLRLAADLGSLAMLLGQPVTQVPDVIAPIPVIVLEFVIVAAIHGTIAAGVAKGLATILGGSAGTTGSASAEDSR